MSPHRTSRGTDPMTDKNYLGLDGDGRETWVSDLTAQQVADLALLGYAEFSGRCARDPAVKFWVDRGLAKVEFGYGEGSDYRRDGKIVLTSEGKAHVMRALRSRE